MTNDLPEVTWILRSRNSQTGKISDYDAIKLLLDVSWRTINHNLSKQSLPFPCRQTGIDFTGWPPSPPAPGRPERARSGNALWQRGRQAQIFPGSTGRNPRRRTQRTRVQLGQQQAAPFADQLYPGAAQRAGATVRGDALPGRLHAGRTEPAAGVERGEGASEYLEGGRFYGVVLNICTIKWKSHERVDLKLQRGEKPFYYKIREGGNWFLLSGNNTESCHPLKGCGKCVLLWTTLTNWAAGFPEELPRLTESLLYWMSHLKFPNI